MRTYMHIAEKQLLVLVTRVSANDIIYKQESNFYVTPFHYKTPKPSTVFIETKLLTYRRYSRFC